MIGTFDQEDAFFVKFSYDFVIRASPTQMSVNNIQGIMKEEAVVNFFFVLEILTIDNIGKVFTLRLSLEGWAYPPYGSKGSCRAQCDSCYQPFICNLS